MSNVKLYALAENVRDDINEWLFDTGLEDAIESGETAALFIGKPLSPGAAIVAALFPDVDATVREALGRLVDAWPRQDERRGICREVGIMHDGLCGNDYKSRMMGTSVHVAWAYRPATGFTKYTMPQAVGVTDPAACVAAIEQVIRRVSDGQ